MAAIEELQLLNHVLNVKEWGVVEDAGITEDYFQVYKDTFEYVKNFKKNKGFLPTIETVMNKFETFELVELENIDHVVQAVREDFLYREFKPILVSASETFAKKETTAAIQQLQMEAGRFLKSIGLSGQGYSYIENAQERLDTYDKIHGRAQDEIIGMTTGFKPLDLATNGLEYTDGAVDYFLVFAPTNMGKTLISSFMMSAAWNSTLDDDYPAYFALEQRASEIAHHWDNTLAKVSRLALTRGTLSNEKRDAYAEFIDRLKQKKKDMVIYDLKSNGGKPFMLDEIRRILEREGHNRWTLDQLSKLRLTSRESGDLRQRLFDVSAGVRDLILDTGKPAIVVAQANRDALKRVKKDTTENVDAGDIGETFAIVQDASKGISIVKVSDNTFRILVIKNRENASGQSFLVRYDFDSGIVSILDDSIHEQYF
ncbi:DnaB-like helicase C-terminal domain-containing protein [Paenibacillus silvae]|uniref:DnaB-like helicase C-terminal domain-containing protein n=1 Tax=Paenibacillus silvae TaxID=1325358 RepID=UPI002004A090|nr:DnaB-like helicase C-terminal domain-containing protein [Paenibacillus silvae]MCK6076895.1 DNA helicase [Paenibacillus silvae]MCK6152337.1 DNA helicase [Paenibacillus silvae]MCK6269598.1 DNA helicase [Paenibacillus silvae]